MDPVSLFKYRNFNSKNHLENLKKNTVFFSSPNNLGDPNDALGMFVYDNYSDDELIHLSKEKIKLSNPNLKAEEIGKIHSELFDLNSAREAVRPENQYEFLKEHLNGHLGILSLSGSNNNIKMWTNNAGNSKGFCIEYDYYLFKKWISYFVPGRNIQIKGFFKVKYTDQLPEFHYKNFSATDEIKAYTTKKTEWSYQEEYRLFILEKTNFSYNLNPNIIKAIYLGYNVSAANEKYILDVVNMILPHVKVFKGKFNSINFSLEFEEIS